MARRGVISAFNSSSKLCNKRLLMRSSFIKMLDRELNVIYDEYVSFVTNLYNEIGNFTSDTFNTSQLNKVCDLVREDVRKSSRMFIKDFVSKKETKALDYEELGQLLDGVFSIYYEKVCSYYRKTSMDFILNKLKNVLEDISQSEEFIFLRIYDKAFLSFFQLKFDSFRDSCLEFVKFTDSTVLDELYVNILYGMKSHVVSNASECIFDVLGKEIAINKKSIDEGFLRDFGVTFFENSTGENKDLVESNSLVDEIEPSYCDGFTFIDDYKDLNKIANENGFELVRCNGDHGIFKSSNGMVVIPQGRSIGKGLSIKIQKTIDRYKSI